MWRAAAVRELSAAQQQFAIRRFTDCRAACGDVDPADWRRCPRCRLRLLLCPPRPRPVARGHPQPGGRPRPLEPHSPPAGAARAVGGARGNSTGSIALWGDLAAPGAPRRPRDEACMGFLLLAIAQAIRVRYVAQPVAQGQSAAARGGLARCLRPLLAAAVRVSDLPGAAAGRRRAPRLCSRRLAHQFHRLVGGRRQRDAGCDGLRVSSLD